MTQEIIKHLYIGTDVTKETGDFENATLEQDGSRIRLKMELTEEQTRKLRDTLNQGLGE